MGAFVALAGAPARADQGEGTTVAAESLFQEARRLMDAKQYGEACPKFLASHKMAPAVGTLLNLADCYEKNGQLASAWARFHEAVALAQRFGRSDREKVARDRANKLEPRLSRVTITAADAKAAVKLDGAPLDSGALGTAMPVDPGKHTIEATAKGKKPYSTTLTVDETNTPATLDIPPLEDVSAEKPKPPEPIEDKPAEKKQGGTQRTLALVSVAGGVALLGVGAVFGLRTRSKWAEAQDHCEDLECDDTGVGLVDEANTAGTISTVAFVAGGVLAAAGVVVYLTAPRSAKAAKKSHTSPVVLDVGALSVGLRARF